LAEIADVFKPKDGKLWVLYEGGLKKAIQCKDGECTPLDKAPMTISPSFLRFFNQAVKFSRALYADAGADPNYHYALSLQKSDQIDSVEVTVNGDHAKLPGGTKKDYIWPGGTGRNFKVTLNLAGGTSTGLPPRDGLWSVFRFFADADKTTFNGTAYDFLWSPRQGRDGGGLIIADRPLSYTFTVDTNGAPAVFSKEFLAGLKCLPVGAK
jgi:type VI protein secretion system component VasK